MTTTNPPNSFFSLHSLPLPSTYENKKLSYSRQWKDYREDYSKTYPSSDAREIRGLEFVASGDKLWLIACTSTGHAYIWDISRPNSLVPEDDAWMDESIPTEEAGLKEAVLGWEVGKVSLHSVRVSRDDTSTWLIVSGEGGVHLYDWNKDIVPRLKSKSTATLTARLKLEPHPSPSESAIVIHDSLIDSQSQYLYAAAGDAFGCYKFDLSTGKVVCTYKQPSNVCAVASVGNQLLTGGVSGEIGIWDTQTDQTCGMLLNQDRPRSNSSPRRKSSPPARIALSSIVTHDDQWWSVGGKSSHGGYICTWHGPSRSIVSQVDTREAIQCMAAFNGKLVTAGNESHASHWDSHACNLSPDSDSLRVPCSGVPSIQAIAVHQFYWAVAGVGKTVLVYHGMNQYVRLSV